MYNKSKKPKNSQGVISSKTLTPESASVEAQLKSKIERIKSVAPIIYAFYGSTEMGGAHIVVPERDELEQFMDLMINCCMKYDQTRAGIRLIHSTTSAIIAAYEDLNGKEVSDGKYRNYIVWQCCNDPR